MSCPTTRIMQLLLLLLLLIPKIQMVISQKQNDCDFAPENLFWRIDCLCSSRWTDIKGFKFILWSPLLPSVGGIFFRDPSMKCEKSTNIWCFHFLSALSYWKVWKQIGKRARQNISHAAKGIFTLPTRKHLDQGQKTHIKVNRHISRSKSD